MLIFEMPDFEEFARRRKLGELQVGHLKTLLYETISNVVREVHPNYICIPRSESVLLLLGSPLEGREALAKQVLHRCRGLLKNLPVHVGLGEEREASEQVVYSYREAESALRLGRNLRTAGSMEGRIHVFSALGIQRLLFTLRQKNPEALRDFEEGSIGIVILYDEQHGTELVKTLKTYMDCDGDISEAADLLHVHKHTVRYRLRRVNELTGLDVTKFQDAAQLYLAVRAADPL